MILQHIAQDILRITLTSTHLRNFFPGEEGDLPVGFPDRFNSRYCYFSFFSTWIGSAISPLFFNRSPSNLIGIYIMTRGGAVYFFMPKFKGQGHQE